jgi:hypothetical protein
VNKSIFEECKEYTFEKTYIELLDAMARGNFPQGVVWYEKEKRLSNERENKHITLDGDVFDTLGKLVDFFREDHDQGGCDDDNIQGGCDDDNASISSRRDSIDTFTTTTVDDIGWKKLKRETKEKILFEYVSTLQTRYNISFEKISHFEIKLNLALQLHTIDADDIVIEGGKIKTITSVRFDENTREFIFPLTSRVNEKETAQHPQSRLTYYIKKFLHVHGTKVGKSGALSRAA